MNGATNHNLSNQPLSYLQSDLIDKSHLNFQLKILPWLCSTIADTGKFHSLCVWDVGDIKVESVQPTKGISIQKLCWLLDSPCIQNKEPSPENTLVGIRQTCHASSCLGPITSEKTDCAFPQLCGCKATEHVDFSGLNYQARKQDVTVGIVWNYIKNPDVWTRWLNLLIAVFTIIWGNYTWVSGDMIGDLK